MCGTGIGKKTRSLLVIFSWVTEVGILGGNMKYLYECILQNKLWLDKLLNYPVTRSVNVECAMIGTS
jgi:hypothetical protein